MDITKLIEENENLKTEIIELKEQLKKYTYGNTHKRYYEKNKERVKEGGANYLKHAIMLVFIFVIYIIV